MLTRRSLRSLAILVLLAFAGTAAAGDEEDRPAVDTPVGGLVFEDVRAAYRTDRHDLSQEAVADVASSDAARRTWGGKYLLALFRQTRRDETEGRAPKRKGTLLWEGPQEAPAILRWSALRRLEKVSLPEDAPELLPLALGLWQEEGTSQAREVAMWLLSRVHAPEADEVIAAAVRGPDPSAPVLELALGEVGRRRLPDLGDAISVLARHPRQPVRAAAAFAAGELGMPIPSRSAGLFPPLERRLRELAACVFPDVPPNAPWIRATRTWDDKSEGHEEGWLLETPDAPRRVVTWTGELLTLQDDEYSTWSFTRDSLEGARDRLLAWRAEFDATEDDRARRDIEARVGIQRAMSLSGERWSGSLPEGLVAAWALLRGDVATAEMLLFPLLERWDDEARMFALFSSDLATRLDARMLGRFATRRWDEALDLARHLSTPAVSGWREQRRARELVEEIPRRRGDFATLTLPTPSEWKAIVDGGSRERSIAFLVERFRLLRSRQNGFPGWVPYEAVQYAGDEDSLPWSSPERARGERVNPATELLALNPSGTEMLALLPALRSTDHVLAYDQARFIPHDPMDLHRVRRVAAWVFDLLAWKEVVPEEGIQEATPEAIDGFVRTAEAWCRDEGSRRFTERLVAAAAPDVEEHAADGALSELGRFDLRLATETAVLRAGLHVAHRGTLLQRVRALDRPEVARPALRVWLEDADPRTRFYAAWILLRHDPPSRARAAEELIAQARAEGGWRLQDLVYDDLVTYGGDAGIQFLESAMSPSVKGAKPTALLLQRRMLAGDPRALARLLAGLDGRPAVYDGEPLPPEPGESSITPEAELADGLVWTVNAWRPRQFDLPPGSHPAGIAARAAFREPLKAWLADQFARIVAKRPREIRRMEPHFDGTEEYLFPPAWSRER